MNSPFDDMQGIDQEETQSQQGDTEAGMESFHMPPPVDADKITCIPFFQMENERDQVYATMCHCGGRPKDSPLLVRTSDGKNFRIYMKSSEWFTQPYINRLCRFLDSRQTSDTVTFVLGSKMSDYQAHILGSLISSMMSCNAQVTTIVAGYCGICETIIWCFGKNRVVYRYGALTFGHTRIVKDCPVYMNYFDVFYQQAVQIGVLTQEEATKLKEQGSTMMLLSHEIDQRLQNKTA